MTPKLRGFMASMTVLTMLADPSSAVYAQKAGGVLRTGDQGGQLLADPQKEKELVIVRQRVLRGGYFCNMDAGLKSADGKLDGRFRVGLG